MLSVLGPYRRYNEGRGVQDYQQEEFYYREGGSIPVLRLLATDIGRFDAAFWRKDSQQVVMVREEGDGYAFLLALFPHPRDVGLIIRSTNSTAYLKKGLKTPSYSVPIHLFKAACRPLQQCWKLSLLVGASVCLYACDSIGRTSCLFHDRRLQ